VQIVAATPRLLDQLDDRELGPARAAADGAVVNPRRFNRRAERAEVIRCRRDQRLIPFS